MRQWIALFEGKDFTSSLYFDGTLYHATDSDSVESCLRDGLKPTSYWAIGAVAEYYVGCHDDEGSEGVILAAKLDDFDESLFEPDYPGLEEPVIYSLGKRDEQIWSEWEASEKTWRDSLRIIGSVRYTGVVKPYIED